MRIQFHQLAAHLRRGVTQVYLICGDEPLQLGDATKAVREEAAKQGFAERELLEQDAGFDWGRLSVAVQALSLFSSRRLIELRVTTPRLGREGAQTVSAYCERPPDDDLLLIVAPNLEHKELKARWVQAVERAGTLLQVRQLEGDRLVGWIEQRLRASGLEPAAGVSALLAERVEGNLLAAAQEVEKLRLLYPAGALDQTRLTSAIADSARFDVFDLAEAVLAGHRPRAQRVLSGLAAEGTAPALVLWVLLRELRMLAEVAYAVPAGSVAAVLDAHKVWPSRRPLVKAALQRLPLNMLHALIGRCATADREVKGLAAGDPWHALATIADAMAAPPDGAAMPEHVFATDLVC
jgi:DNA polymerase III subunit delta